MTEKYRMNAVTFLDSWGKVRITVSTSSEGDPYLTILDKDGNISAIFAVNPDEEPYITRPR